MNEQEVNMLKRLTLVMVLVGVLLVPMTASAQNATMTVSASEER